MTTYLQLLLPNSALSFARLPSSLDRSGQDTHGIHGGIGRHASRARLCSGWMYIGYFILRSALEGDKRRIYAAVLGIIAYLDVPIIYYAVDIWQGGLHPDRGTKWSLEATMRHTWMVALLALILLFTFLLIVRYRMKKAQARYEAIQQQHLTEASS